MVFGVGIDLIETARIKRSIETNISFRDKVFSEREIGKCEATSNKYQCYAARFAGKEAFMKALGTGWAKGLKWHEIEILNDAAGKPFLELTGKTKQITAEAGIVRMNISLSHLQEIATAIVILETNS